MPHRPWLAVPRAESDPVEKLRFSRRMEIVGGIGGLVMAAAFWSGAGRWHWLLLGGGLLALSPWPGPAAILRRAERDPSILDHGGDPVRRRRRVRRLTLALIPFSVAPAAVAGYLAGGWGAAAFCAGVAALGSGIGAWWSLRRFG
jgi:hypothetical protein